jgi:hypothetical protein
VVPALGHSFTTYKPNTDATCTADSTDISYCDHSCGTYDVIVNEGTLTPDAHSLGEWITEGNKSTRSCELGGYTETKVTTDDGDVEIEAPNQPGLDFNVAVVKPADSSYVLVEKALDSVTGMHHDILRVFDITLENAAGDPVQPNGTVKVKIPFTVEEGRSYKVYRVNDDGTLTNMEATCEEGYLVFATDHFSLYAIVEETEHTHGYEAVVTDPTCTTKGYTTYTCSCGDSYEDDYVDAPGHDFVAGKCNTCGESDPDYVPARLLGDVTGDGKVTATDYSRLLAHVKKVSLLTDEDALWAADVTGDGKITATDYSRLLAHVKKVAPLW